ncbi:FecR family protein [Mucilaginibacter flavus]|uniref:FecR family protein n=1 Tax=Mucilaginibacter flavus TaxID=931504 RepID=UPI0025B421E1|nr:FecR domain-containing protein [Mucilaginibacter flavus]MDN3581404.1 FecR domain-containing protein [Mucilaginibacter flavus]
MDIANYSTYTLQNFLDDDDFLRFVISPSQKDVNFWQSVTAVYPTQKENIEEASKIILAYRKQDVFTNEANQQKVWDRIEATLQKQGAAKQTVFQLNRFLRVAASILLVSSIGIAYWMVQYNSKTEISTAFGELRTVTLPDNSVVVLNGNSKLSYSGNWDKNSREVWISGEGFFKVNHLNKDPRHIKTTERFIVHCNDVNIEVLGTSFNVRNRHNKTNVGLVTGKIRLEYLDQKSNNNRAIIMKPGDYVEYAQKHVVAQTKLAVPAKLTEWTNHELLFNNSTLAQIAEVMADDYGYHVDFANPQLANLKIEGEISVSNIGELIETITTTLPVKITQTDKNITITSINP